MLVSISAVLPSTTLIHLEHLKIIGRFLLSSWVLEIWLWLTMNQQVWPMSVLIRRHSMFLGLKSFRRWKGWCHCYCKLQIEGFRTYPPAGRVIKFIKGSWPLFSWVHHSTAMFLFFFGSSWGLEDWILSGQVACTYKVFEDLRSVVWEVWRNRSVFCNTWYL